MDFLFRRPRRNRKTPAVREMVREIRLHPSNFVSPLFLTEGSRIRDPIPSLPGISRFSIDEALVEAEALMKLGIPAVMLFPYVSPELRDLTGSEALNPNAMMQQAIRAFKKELPELCLITDVALDPYTSHGHDGIVNAKGEIDNDATLKVLSKMALVQAEAGIDIIAPSDMMDGRVGTLRSALDQADFSQVSIMSYTAKYASSLYAPFREALRSTPRFSDKKTYQMDIGNSREALIEAALDEVEGADYLLVKPALFYLDIISKVKAKTNLPLVAYQVSGEYAMIHAAAQKGWMDSDKVMLEALTAIKRAGADIIVSYAARWIAEYLKEHGQ